MALAEKEYQDRLAELMDSMLQECEEQKKQIEHEYHNTDINSTASSSYPVNKKSLRRYLFSYYNSYYNSQVL